MALSSAVDQFDPPSREYSAKKYAVALAEPELAIWKCVSFAPPEQAFRVLETEVSIIGQSTVELAERVV